MTDRSRADLAIDTNVFIHASRPDEPMFADGVKFLTEFMATTLSIGVDPGFALDQALNRSLIGSEYVNRVVTLPPGALGREVLTALFSSTRVRELALTMSGTQHKAIKKFIKRGKPRDRTFLKVAFLTERRQLVTHDFEDFPTDKRKEIKNALEVHVCTAGEWAA